MRKIIKNLLIFIISNLAHTIYFINKPFVIGVTGSVGKTSTRESIYLLLHSKYGDDVFQSPKNFNGDIGLPLTFLQQDTGYNNIFLWFKLIWMSLIKIVIDFINLLVNNNNYPKYLIAEYGVDHPGEMDTQLNVAVPNIAIVTKIAPVHTHEFGNLKNIAIEKSKIVRGLLRESFAILNYDDIRVRNMSKITNSKIIFFGKQQKGVDIGYSNIKETIDGINFTIHDNKNSKRENIKIKMLGKYNVYIILPAVAVGVVMGMTLKEIVEVLLKYKPPKGRMRILKGISNSIIIDGSYNASPSTMLSAIQTMEIFKKMNRVLFLGDMRELGQLEEKEHKSVAKLIVNYSDYVVLVGPLMSRYTVPELIKLGYPQDRIFTTPDSIVAGERIVKIIQSNKNKTVVICKGSQNTIRIEKGIKKFLSIDTDPKTELPRQDSNWLTKN